MRKADKPVDSDAIREWLYEGRTLLDDTAFAFAVNAAIESLRSDAQRLNAIANAIEHHINE